MKAVVLCRYLRRGALICCCLICLAGCTTHRPVVPVTDGPFWPSGGEPVRIRYSGSFSGPEELGIETGMLTRIWDFITGGPSRSLVNPLSVTTDVGGTVYVVDGALQQVSVYDLKRQDFRRLPDDDMFLQAPINVLADISANRLFVSDSAAGVIRLVPLAAGAAPGELGIGQLVRPTGIALNRQTDELLVVDSRKSTVFRYDRASLVVKGSFGGRGAGAGQFNYPTAVAVNSKGEILICDSLNFRVQVFSAEGEFRRAFGRVGDRPGSFSRPKGIAVDSDDNIYVLDTLFDNVQIFDREGQLLLAFGSHGQAEGQFWMPTGIHIDSSDKIYVADTYNKRVQLFQYQKQTVK